MPYIYLYQLSVCNYYNQYYESTGKDKNIYLHQAKFSTKLLKWLEKNANQLSKELADVL